MMPLAIFPCRWCGGSLEGTSANSRVCVACRQACVACGEATYVSGLCLPHYGVWLRHRKPNLERLRELVDRQDARGVFVSRVFKARPCTWCQTSFSPTGNERVCPDCQKACVACGKSSQPLVHGLCRPHFNVWVNQRRPPLARLIEILAAREAKQAINEQERLLANVVAELQGWQLAVDRDTPLGELPLSPRILGILTDAGLRTAADVLAANLTTLAALPGFAAASLRHVLQVLGNQDALSTFSGIVSPEQQAEHTRRAEALLRERLGFDPAAGDADCKKYAGVAGLSYSV